MRVGVLRFEKDRARSFDVETVLDGGNVVHGFDSERDRLLQHLVVQRAFHLGHSDETSSDGIQGHAAELARDVAADLFELVARECEMSLYDFVHDDAIRTDDDADDLAVGNEDEVDAADRELKQSGHEHDADLIAELGEQLRGQVKDFFDLTGVTDLIVDRMPLGLRQTARVHHVVDEKAIPAIGGDPTGRGVRLLQVPEILEVSHHIPKARRRKLETAALGERARANRLAAGDMLQNDLAQDFASPAIEAVVDFQFLNHR